SGEGESCWLEFRKYQPTWFFLKFRFRFVPSRFFILDVQLFDRMLASELLLSSGKAFSVSTKGVRLFVARTRYDHLAGRLAPLRRAPAFSLRYDSYSLGSRNLAAPAALWCQAVAIAQFSRCLQVFSRSHQLSDLPDMSQIVHGPLMQHLL